MGTLAGGIAHDFNNLLMVIGAYAELALDAMKPEDPLRHNLQQILAASLRAGDLTRQLLVFGRRQTPRTYLISLNSIVAETCRLLPKVLGRDIELEVVLGKGLGQIKADPAARTSAPELVGECSGRHAQGREVEDRD